MNSLFIWKFLPSGQDYIHITEPESEAVGTRKPAGMASPLLEAEYKLLLLEGMHTLPPSLRTGLMQPWQMPDQGMDPGENKPILLGCFSSETAP